MSSVSRIAIFNLANTFPKIPSAYLRSSPRVSRVSFATVSKYSEGRSSAEKKWDAGDQAEELRRKATKAAGDANGAFQDKLHQTQRDADDFKETATDKANEMKEGAVANMHGIKEKTMETAGSMSEKTKKAAGDMSDKTKEAAGAVSEKTQKTAGDVLDKTKEASNRAGDKANEMKEATMDMADEAKDKAKEGGSKTAEVVQNVGEKAKQTAQGAWEVAKDTTQKVKETLVGKDGENEGKTMGERVDEGIEELKRRQTDPDELKK